MPENRKRLTARFYESANGRAPVRDWLLEMGDDDRRTIGKDIANCRPLVTAGADLDLARKRLKEVE